MHHVQLDTQSRVMSLMLACLAALVVACIIIYPSAVFQSSLNGMTLWWEYVFPALLPFLILTEIMLGTGALHAIGTLLDPFMRLFFRVSGNSGWALAMGLFAGYPAGASSTAKLQEKQALLPLEAERTLIVTHLCNPAVMITVIGVGFFQQFTVGIFIAIIHYISALLVGLILYQSVNKSMAKEPNPAPVPLSLWTKAMQSAKQAQLDDGRKFGKILGDGVTQSLQVLMIIGGWIMFFSVLQQVILLLLPELISRLGFVNPLIVSLLEPHLGAFAIAQDKSITLVIQVAVVGAILGWSGFSVHTQVKSLLLSLQMRYRSFLLARMLHAALAFSLTLLLWKPLNTLLSYLEPRSVPTYIDAEQSDSLTASIPDLWTYGGIRTFGYLSLLAFILVCSIFISWGIQKLQLWGRKSH